jgi:ACR3 family arsenite efflux pump ArsB
MRGAVAGFGLVLVFSLAWAAFVLLRAWVEGDFERAFPDCDPCGFTGYAFRMVVVTAIFIGMFGVPAAVVGWLVEIVARWSSRNSARGDPR